MNRSLAAAIALAAAAVLLAPLAAAQDQVAKLGSATTIYKGVVGVLPGGGVTCVGGELNQKAPWPPCTPATTTTRIRGLLTQEEQNRPDAPWSGSRTNVLNANLDKDGRGPVWGTWRMEVTDRTKGAPWGCGPMALTCAFEGTYTGQLLGFGQPGELHVIGYGVQGAVEGIKGVIYGALDPGFNGVYNGYYYPPPKK